MEQALIDQVVARVVQKITEAEAKKCNAECSTEENNKPTLLILTQQHGDDCHQMLESKKLLEHYSTLCALQEDYQCDLANCDVVILYQFTNEAMAKVATGICDTPYTKLISKALLLGKRIFIPNEEVEMFRYASSAPTVYYAMLEEKLKFLTASGIVICPKDEMEDAIINGVTAVKASVYNCNSCSNVKKDTGYAVKEQKLSKRVITEQDIIKLKKDDVTRVYIGERAILTDIADDLAKSSGIEIVR